MIPPQFVYAEDFSNGRARVNVGGTLYAHGTAVSGGENYYIDVTGRRV